MATASKPSSNATAEEQGPQFGIQRIYTKDISFESPNTPALFREQWQPKVNMEINTSAKGLDKDIHEITLDVTVTAKLEDKVAFLAEVKTAGIFSMSDFSEDQLKQMIGSFCPNILFPYAREAITDLVTRGGFPQLYLAPINFDALFTQQQQQTAEKANTGSAES